MKLLKEEAIYNFFSSFGVNAYEENSVPTGGDKPEFPYITYELVCSTIWAYDRQISFSIWDRNSSWSRIAAIKDAISYRLGTCGVRLEIDGGYILVMRDEPFAQALGDETDNTVKRYLCNVKMRFYCNY